MSQAGRTGAKPITGRDPKRLNNLWSSETIVEQSLVAQEGGITIFCSLNRLYHDLWSSGTIVDQFLVALNNCTTIFVNPKSLYNDLWLPKKIVEQSLLA